MREAILATLSIVLCIYLLLFRPLIKERYPLFYAYLLISACFELFLFICNFGADLRPSPQIIAYQLIYIFQLYLLATLWREVLQRDYHSLRLVVYSVLALSSLIALGWSAHNWPVTSFRAAVQSALVLHGLAAPSFFAALMLLIAFKEFRIPIPRSLRGIIYGLTLLTGFDFMAIFVSEALGFPDGYIRLAPWLGSLVIYCRYLASPNLSTAELIAEQQAMLTMSEQLQALDQRVFYGLMVKSRLYNPFTQAYYYRFCSPGSLNALSPTATNKAHFQRLYREHRYAWAGPYYRLVDPLILRLLSRPSLGAEPIRPKSFPLPDEASLSPVRRD